MCVFFFKQKTAYEMRISDWSSDVCSSDLPGLATDGPELVGWHQLVGGIQGPQVHFDFVGAASEDGGTVAGTEKPPGVVACFAVDRHRILREHRGRVKPGPMLLVAVEPVTKADLEVASRRHKTTVAAKARSGEQR